MRDATLDRAPLRPCGSGSGTTPLNTVGRCREAGSMAENDEAREALEAAEETENSETGDTDSEEVENGETTEGVAPEPEGHETSDQDSGESETATPESAAEQIAALAARIDGIAGEISEIRRWFKMSTVAKNGGEDGPEDLSFDALADFIIGSE